MSFWMRWLFGLEEGEVPEGSALHWELSGMPSGGWLTALVVIVLLCIGIIIVLYRSESTLSRWQRVALSSLRLGALALVVLILLNPRIRTETELVRRGRAILLVDTSASMAERDPWNPEERERLESATGLDLEERPTRAELTVAALRESDFVDRLAERNDVELRLFDKDVRRADPEVLAPEKELAVAGAESRLGDALASVVRDPGRAPIAGVIPLTDGRTTGGLELDEARRDLESHRVPVWPIGVGRVQARLDLAVDEIVVPKRVEIDFPVEIEGRLSLQGAKRPVRVVLERSRRDGTGAEVVGTEDFDPTSGAAERRVRFVDRIEQRGEWRYSLRLPVLEGETRTENNVREVVVVAAEQEYRLLLVAGNAVPEFRFFRNFAIRDDHIVVSSWQATADPRFIQDGDLPIDRLPANAEELDEYDVVVLIDPDPATLSDGFQQALEAFVAESGGGLAYVASEANTPRIAKDGSFARLRRLLPVELDGHVLPAGTVYSEAWRPELTAAGYDHPLCRLTNDPEENRNLWDRAPPFYYAHGSGELRPAAVALLASGEQVIAAVQRVGTGECIYLGTDEFWTWRTADVAFHERFWSVVVRTLAISKRLAGGQEVRLETERDRYRLGEPVRIEAEVVDGRRAPIAGALVDVVIERVRSFGEEKDPDAAASGQERWSLRLAGEGTEPGKYSAVFRAETPGSYRVTHAGSSSSVAFEVRPQATEWDDTSPDFIALEELGAATGGGFALLDSLSAVAEAVPRAEVRETIARRTTAVWDSWAMIVLFSIFLGLEWTLRKLWRLN